MRLEQLRMLMLLVVVSCMLGCGGNSQSNDSKDPVATPQTDYTGISAPAAITSINAQALSAGALIGANAVGATRAPSSSSNSSGYIVDQQQGHINNNIFKLLAAFEKTGENYRTKAVKAAISTTDIAVPMAIIIKNSTILGDCGGEFTYTLNVAEDESFAGKFIFLNYCESGITRNGTYPVDGVYNLLTDEFEILNENITNLTIDAFTQTGDVSKDFTGAPPLTIISSDLFNKNNSTGKTYWVNDYLFNIIDIGTGLEINLNGDIMTLTMATLMFQRLFLYFLIIVLNGQVLESCFAWEQIQQQF